MKIKCAASFVRASLLVAAALPLGPLEAAYAANTDPVLTGAWPGFRRGPARAVAVVGNYAYVAAGAGGLHVIDISSPAKPQRVGGYATSGEAIGVAVTG